MTDAMMYNINWQIRNCLVEIDYRGQLVPELAESWEVSDDATEWVFKLRKGIEFSNGKTLDVEDAIASINLHRGEGSKSGAAGVLAGVEKILADGKDKVVFNLKSGDADFPFILSDYHLANEQTGLQVLQQCSLRLGKTFRGAVISADRTAETQQVIRGHGFSFISKPVKPLKLRALLNQHVRELG